MWLLRRLLIWLIRGVAVVIIDQVVDMIDKRAAEEVVDMVDMGGLLW